MTSNGTISFYICPIPGKEGCAGLFSAYQWKSSGSGGALQNGEGALSWNCTGTGINCGSTCDIVKVYNNGTNIVICVTRRQSSATSRMAVLFNPPLGDPCNFTYNPGGIGYHGPFVNYPTDWNWSNGSDPGKVDSFVFVPTNPLDDLLHPCETKCFRIPICDDDPTPHSVTVITNDAQDADDCNQDFGYTFKIAADGAYLPDGSRAPNTEAVEGNYPNPLTSVNDFKTVIPFKSPTEGEATIRILNQAGQVVLEETIEVTEGKHFFYFTGDMLPAGQYHYYISTSTGVVIARRSMLIVK